MQSIEAPNARLSSSSLDRNHPMGSTTTFFSPTPDRGRDPGEPTPPGMVTVPEGEFLLGEERRRLWISAFHIDSAPVTHREYAEFVAATGHPAPEYWNRGEFPPERADHPVVGVSIDDARAYARWRGKAIPTEEEWEKAARGSDGRTYPWGDLFSSERANVRGAGIRDTTPVGRFPTGKSPYGCVDMVGNVWEWTETAHDAAGRFLTLKGGSWYDVSSYARCAARFSARPDYRGSCVGFRCVKRIGSALPLVRILSGGPEIAPARPRAAPEAEAAAPAGLGAMLRIFDYGEERVLRERLDREIRDAEADLREGRAATARTKLKAVLDRDPGHPRAVGLLAGIPADATDRAPGPPAPSRADRLRRALATPRGRMASIAAATIFVSLLVLAAIPGGPAVDATPDLPAGPERPRPAAAGSAPRARSEPRREVPRERREPRRATAAAPEGMVEIPGGAFPFGPDRTLVDLPPFFIDRLEVTNDKYLEFVRATGHATPLHWIDGRIPGGQEAHPVTFVSFEDAAAYAEWAGKRLPAEEEWEKAAAGFSGWAYPWGESFETGRANIMLSLDDLANAPGIEPVGAHPSGASPFGVEDTVGNVLEWTTSWFDPDTRRVRVLKGGAWSLGREDGRIVARYGFFAPETRNEVIGFRCAQD